MRRPRCLPGVSAAGCLGVDWRRESIVLDIFGQVGLSVGELQNFELFGVGEKHRWSDNGVDIYFQYLVHRLQFSDVPHEVRRFGWARV